MKKSLLIVLLLLALLLTACAGLSQPALSPEPAASEAAPTPEPTPEPTPPPPSSVVLTSESAEEILAMADNPFLLEVDGTHSAETEALAELQRRKPDCAVRYFYDYRGESFASDTRELTVTETEGAEEALKNLPRLEKVDMRAVDWSTEDMERLEEQYPKIDFLWTLHFGSWTVTSDITCFSTLRTGEEGNHRYTNAELYPLLRFCHHLRALDLGHNALTDLTLIGQMSELQVLILADNNTLTDISPLAELKELYYIELFLCRNIEDFTPLAGLTKMLDMNLSYDKLQDLSLLDNYPDFENGWFRNTGVTRDEADSYLAGHPGVTLLVGSPRDPSSTAFGWRDTERNHAIRHAFTYWPTVKDWRHWDDIEYNS